MAWIKIEGLKEGDRGDCPLGLAIGGIPCCKYWGKGCRSADWSNCGEFLEKEIIYSMWIRLVGQAIL